VAVLSAQQTSLCAQMSIRPTRAAACVAVGLVIHSLPAYCRNRTHTVQHVVYHVNRPTSGTVTLGFPKTQRSRRIDLEVGNSPNLLLVVRCLTSIPPKPALGDSTRVEGSG
jgi:hypothetical protein